MISVVIADDHAMFCQGLTSLLADKEDMAFEGVAADGKEALDLILRVRPDVAVLDISMPELTGIEIRQH